MAVTGGCLCGAVRFRAAEIDSHVHGCHCSMCRRWSGGPGLAVNAQGVEFEDESSLVRFDSSEWAQRGFCAKCGSNLFYFLKPAGQYMLWMGALDEVDGLTLDGEIYIDEKPPGYAFAGEHPRQTGEEFLASMQAPPEP